MGLYTEHLRMENSQKLEAIDYLIKKIDKQLKENTLLLKEIEKKIDYIQNLKIK